MPTEAGAWMSTLTVQEVAPAGKLPLLRTMLLPLAVSVPPQVLITLGKVATVCPAGKVSLKDRPVNAGAPVACVSVTVRVVSWLGLTDVGL